MKNERILEEAIVLITKNIEEIVLQYKGMALTPEVIETLTSKLGVFNVIFYDNFGNSNYNCPDEDFLDSSRRNGNKLFITGKSCLVSEAQNLVYTSTIHELYVDVECSTKKIN